MKNFLYILPFLIAATAIVPESSLAQTSNIADLLHFTAVARDVSGTTIANTPVSVNVKIYTGNPANTGTLEYCEQVIDTTNAFGEFSLEFGTNPILLCQPYKQMSEVPWHSGNKWVDIRFQTGPSNPFIPIATFKLTSVPFSFATRTAERTIGIETTGAVTGQVLKYDGQNFRPEADQSGDGFPVGIIIAFGGPVSKVPTGWYLCNGDLKNRTTDAALFEIIGNFWGSGNGTTTFNLPDLRGQFLRGATSDPSLDPDVNSRTVSAAGLPKSEVGSKQGDATALPNNTFTGVTNTTGNHEHYLAHYTTDTGNVDGTLDSDETLSLTGSWNSTGKIMWGENCEYKLQGRKNVTANRGLTSTIGNHNHTVQITGNGDLETRPKNVYVNYIIKH